MQKTGVGFWLILAAAVGGVLIAQDDLGNLSGKAPSKKLPSFDPARPTAPAPRPTQQPPTQQPPAPSGRGNAPPSANWATFNSPSGYRVQHPAGWSFQDSMNAQKMPVIRGQAQDSRASVMVMPFFDNARATAQTWLARNFGTILAAQYPGASQPRLTRISQQPDQVAASFDYRSPAGPAHASVLCWMNRGSGMMFAISAPTDQYAARKSELVRILKSFQFTQAAAQAGGGQQGAPETPRLAVNWTRWSDPTEGAASLDVPQGWKVTGGVSRQFGAVAPILAIRMTSPDGKMVVGINDHNVPPYVQPGQFTREGTWYSPGYGTKMFVLRVLPGAEYAQFYATNFLLKGSQVALRDKKDRPELVRFQNQLSNSYSTPGIQTRASAGEVSFETNIGGQPTAGYVLASTSSITMEGMGTWNVQGLYFFLAPAGQAAAVSQMVSHVLESVKVNPQWFASNQKMVGDISKIVTDTNNYISKMQSESYWNRQKAQDRSSQRFSDYIRGVQRVKDPETGEVYEARSGYNYYYRPRGDDRPIGSDSPDVPQYIDVTPLEKID